MEKILASGAWDGTLKLWDVATRTNIATLKGHTEPVVSVSFSPDGKILASGSHDATVKLWNIPTLTNIVTFSHHFFFTSVSFSPDGTILAAGSLDGIKLWNIETKKNFATLEHRGAAVEDLAFSPDGTILAAAGTGGKVELWDVGTRTAIATFPHTDAVTSVTFSPDGSTLASAGEGGKVELWDVSSLSNRDQLPEARDSVDISDHNLRTALEGILSKAPGDPIPPAEMATLTRIEYGDGLVGAGISDLTGLEFATNLTHLALSSNSISDISPLEGLTKLTVLNLEYNAISDLSPLVANLGLGNGSEVNVRRNPLNPASINTHIPALLNRGVNVSHAHQPLVKVVDPGSPTIYWTDLAANKIQYANPDDSRGQDIITTGKNFPEGIALDSTEGKIYWVVPQEGKIQRADLDGTNVEVLTTPGFFPKGIALDVDGGKMYWAGWGPNIIRRANLDGTNVEVLVTVESGIAQDIALDVDGGKMYWTDTGTNKIQRANLDGTNVEDLVTTGLDWPESIALDVEGGKMYWTDVNTYKIQRANLDGSNIEDLVTAGSAKRIALDLNGRKMYWTLPWKHKIQWANFDGSDIEDVITGLGNPAGIALGSVPVDTMNPTAPVPEDVNRDGVVDIDDLVFVAQRYRQTGTNAADINGDQVVNVVDLILVAAAVDAAEAAPALHVLDQSVFTPTQLRQWIAEARASGNTSLPYQKGILMLEHLLALLPPEETTLLANYPNPFNPETWIPYQLAAPTAVELTIYAANGQIVRTLTLGHQPAGIYESRNRAAYWDGKNALGEPMASGIYFYTLTAGDFTATRRMLILK